MGEELLLSELCAICHLSRPKYKCPQCTVQTCSLQCVKRHKLWSQCSGTRDPAAYRKRRELATPSSVDQDYNFITKVETLIQRAGDEAEERGLSLKESRRKLAKGEARRDSAMHQRGAIVLRAPAGMTRALQNGSKWNNRHKCIMWTVEWIFENGSKVLGNCQEIRTVHDAFTNSCAGRQLLKTPSLAMSPLPRPTGEGSSDSVESVKNGSSTKTYFYLHRPNLPSNVKCVIPVQANATLKDIVRDRVLIEFPTIFVLTVSEEMLQRPFITEDSYVGQADKGPAAAIPDAQERDGGPL